MTDKIEDELNLPRLKEVLKTLKEENNEKETDKKLDNPKAIDAWVTALKNIKKIDKSLNDFDYLGSHATEMDEISKEAINSYKDLIELGFNVETKHSGQIFDPATQMLKVALEARNSKVEKKLKYMRLELDKAKFERDLNNENSDNFITVGENEDTILAERNSLLEKIREKVNVNENDKYIDNSVKSDEKNLDNSEDELNLE